MVFIEQSGLEILLEMLAPAKSHGSKSKSYQLQHQKDAAGALFMITEKASSFSPVDSASLPATPEAYIEEHFNNPELSDITFVVKQKEFHAHRIAFAHASDSFHEMLDRGQRDKNGTKLKIEIDDFHYSVFEAMMRFIYTGSVKASANIAQELLHAADHYSLEGLKQQCESMIARDIDVENLEFVLDLSETHKAPNLGHACVIYALEHQSRIVKELTAPVYSALVARMAPRIKDYLCKVLQRVGNLPEERTQQGVALQG